MGAMGPAIAGIEKARRALGRIRPGAARSTHLQRARAARGQEVG